MSPYVLGGAGLVLIGGLVLVLRGSNRKPAEPAPAPAPSRRLSDEDLKASLPKSREAPAATPAAAGRRRYDQIAATCPSASTCLSGAFRSNDFGSSTIR